MTAEIIQKLNQLSDAEAHLDAIRLRKQDAIEKALTPEIRQALADIDIEFDAQEEGAREKIADMRKRVQEAVKAHGASVKGDYLQAVFSNRSSWDSKALTGFAAAHPEILAFCKKSTSVSIRRV